MAARLRNTDFELYLRLLREARQHWQLIIVLYFLSLLATPVALLLPLLIAIDSVLGTVSPVIYRPLFDHLNLIICRTFETPAANTIPLFCQERQFVQDIYGDAGLELVLPKTRPEDKIVDLFDRPQHYLQVVGELRHFLAQRYSYAARVKELVEIVGN